MSRSSRMARSSVFQPRRKTCHVPRPKAIAGIKAVSFPPPLGAFVSFSLSYSFIFLISSFICTDIAKGREREKVR